MSKKDRILLAGAIVGMIGGAVSLIPNIVNATKAVKSVQENPELKPHVNIGTVVAVAAFVLLLLWSD